MEYNLLTLSPIILFPFLAFVINFFLGRKLPRQGDFISLLGILLTFLWVLPLAKDFFYNHHSSDTYVYKVFEWINLGSILNGSEFKINLGFYIDNMTVVMLLMVTFVSSLIHLFSTYYMKGDSRYGKFFLFLSLFSTAMIALVLSHNLIGMFIFWEIMGFCSYSLIGFYQENEKAGDASLKAFMTTRVGDVCFLLGILAIWSVIGSVDFVDIYNAIQNGSFDNHFVMGVPVLGFAGFCLFMGTIGKSAQFPLQVWLPDAMMGPTPCSALIHAATMVAAGVYLSLRLFPVLEAAKLLDFVAFIGALTALGAATIALVQTELKGVLAFSTVSQLGFMVLGIGVGAYNPAFMHLVTHAVFKACLFLAAGSVIHSLHDHHTDEHIQDLRRMGGLRKKLPYTHVAMFVCSLAIAGVPFFSAFVSKDRILGDALFWSLKDVSFFRILIPIMAFSAALMTAFYMFRMIFLAFYGKPRDIELYEHAHEEHLQLNRNVPLLILTFLTLGFFYSGSLIGQNDVYLFPKGGKEWFQALIEKPVLEKFLNRKPSQLGFVDNDLRKEFPLSYWNTKTNKNENFKKDEGGNIVLVLEEKLSESQEKLLHLQHSAHIYGAIISIFIAILGIGFAYIMYLKKIIDPDIFVTRFKKYHKTLVNRYYFDFFYQDILLARVLIPAERLLARFDMHYFDRIFVDGWSIVIQKCMKINRWFDEKVVDATVDFMSTFVKLFNVILRTFQSGKIQFYFIILVIIFSSFVLMVMV
jgi:NADH-quinone oxidoreductase subunit L